MSFSLIDVTGTGIREICRSGETKFERTHGYDEELTSSGSVKKPQIGHKAIENLYIKSTQFIRASSITLLLLKLAFANQC